MRLCDSTISKKNALLHVQHSAVSTVCTWHYPAVGLVFSAPFAKNMFFPRASERRVLLIVEVCHHILYIFSSSDIFLHLLIFTPSHLHIFSSSHLLIFTSSHLHTFSSSHLLLFTSSSYLLMFTSSYIFLHPLIFTPSLAFLPSRPLALSSLLLFYFSLKARGSAQRGATKRNPFLRNELRSSKTQVKWRFSKFCGNPFARNEVRSSKKAVKLRF